MALTWRLSAAAAVLLLLLLLLVVRGSCSQTGWSASGSSSGSGASGSASGSGENEAVIVTVEFEDTEYSVNETDGSVMFRIVKRTRTTREVSVLFSTVDGTAVAAAAERDYANISNHSVTFLPELDEVTIIINVSVTPDEIYEDTENFTAVLTLPDGADRVILGVDSTALANIIDDDVLSIGFQPTEYTVAEGEGNVTLALVRRGASEVDVFGRVTTSSGTANVDTDYGAQNQSEGTVQFPASPSLVQYVTISIPIINDSVAETMESFAAVLMTQQESVSVQNGTANITITDK